MRESYQDSNTPPSEQKTGWDEIGEQSKQSSEMHFSPIGEKDIQTIADLEKQLYNEETLQYQDHVFLEEILDEPESEKYSFIMEGQVDGASKPVGYCLAYDAEPMSDPDFKGKTAYIADFGIIPEARLGINPALESFNELLSRTEENGVDMIEMETRQDTSYRMFSSKYVQRILARRGYTVTDHGVSDNEWEDGDVTYLISIRKKAA